MAATNQRIHMAKRNRNIDQQGIERRLAEGRGQGRGKDYRPWLEVQDVPSTGLATRIKGWKSGRLHHLLSNLETGFFYLMEWSPNVTDTREQLPLLPQSETVAIAEEIGVPHPTNPQTRQPIVMTSDFSVTKATNDSTFDFVRTIKPSSELVSERVLEKFEIERRYWEKRQIDWAIVTERELPKAAIQNIQWVHTCKDIVELGLSNALLAQIEGVLLPKISGSDPLSQLTSACDNRLGLTPGASLSAVRHLIAVRRWVVDMQQTIAPTEPLRLLNATDLANPIEENENEFFSKRVA
jgi:hypothetical protein